jgi:hypothetical protein
MRSCIVGAASCRNQTLSTFKFKISCSSGCGCALPDILPPWNRLSLYFPQFPAVSRSFPVATQSPNFQLGDEWRNSSVSWRQITSSTDFPSDGWNSNIKIVPSTASGERAPTGGGHIPARPHPNGVLVVLIYLDRWGIKPEAAVRALLTADTTPPRTVVPERDLLIHNDSGKRPSKVVTADVKADPSVSACAVKGTPIAPIVCEAGRGPNL